MRVISEVKNLKNKRVLLRVDFNVPVEAGGTVNEKEDWRIRAALPTIKFLIKGGARIILLAHLGRPEGKVVENLRLGPVQDKLSELLDISVERAPDCVGKAVEEMAGDMVPGEILMLENLRFHLGEEANDPDFAKKLAGLGDIYVNDAFSDSHRAHASIVGLAKLLPSYAGLLLAKEIHVLERSMVHPVHPAIAIIGGAKIETKLPTVKYLFDKYENIIVGGAIANDILKIKGLQVGKSLVSPETAGEMDGLEILSPKIIIPVDLVVEGVIDQEGLTRISAAGKVGENETIYDIGPETAKLYAKVISRAKTVIWNGPLGKFEDPRYAKGTAKIAAAVEQAYVNGAGIVIGGGETIYAVEKFAPKLFGGDSRIHISTGGGAMLEFLAGKKLPGIAALG